MSRNIDCEVFQDQLDSLKRGTLGEEGSAQLRRHADSCPDCAVLLRLHEHLAAPVQAELEAAVPDTWVASMWEDVEAEIATRASRRGHGGNRFGGRWLVPALAAASMLLMVASGFLLGERARLRERERTLMGAVADQQRRLAERDSGTASSALIRTGVRGGGVWGPALAERERVTVGELERVLERVPAGVTVLGGPDLENLLDRAVLWMGGDWRREVAEIDAEDGVQAQELLGLLRRLDLDPGLSISTSRIFSVSRRAAGPGRS